MAWIRLEDTFPEHQKIDAAGGDAAWLHVCGIGYCNRNRTDGFIPSERVRRLSDRTSPIKLAEKLVEVGLWERAEGGYVVHDYLEYNPTRAELEAADTKRHEDKAAAGKLGGIASGISRRKHKGSRTEAEHEAEGEAERKQNEAPSRPDPSHPIQVTTSPTTHRLSVPEVEAQDDDDEDVIGIALGIYAGRLAEENAAPAKRRHYADTVIRNGEDHIEGLTDLLAQRPSATPAELAAAYEDGGWPYVSTAHPAANITPADHNTECVCEGTGWQYRGTVVVRCEAVQWNATVHQLRPA